MDINNSSGGGVTVRNNGGGNVGWPSHGRWTPLASGHSLRLPDLKGGMGTVEFRFPDNHTLVQVVDARTLQVSLVKDGHGSYRTILTSSAPPAPKPPPKPGPKPAPKPRRKPVKSAKPKAAAGGRR